MKRDSERDLKDASQAYYEVVFLFRKGEIAVELLYSEFSSVLNNASRLEQFAAERVRCVYAAVSSRLALRGAVCFDLEFDEDGNADTEFNVPVRHLLESAGGGPDFGTGPIKLACRSQCAISWQARNLWEPTGQENKNPLNMVQRALWRNRLGLVIKNDPRDRGRVSTEGESEIPHLNLEECDSKITQAFDQEGRVSLQELIRQHKTQVEKLSTKHRSDLANQQQEYLNQVRKNKDDLQHLKAELRMEQQRSLRLQQLLRGEFNP